MKYYGKEEIEEVTNNGDYTTIFTVDKNRYVISSSEVATLVTDAPVNETDLRSNRCKPIAAGVLMLMKAYNIRQDEVEYVLQLVAQSVNKNMEDAQNKLWGVKNFGEQTFLSVDDVLKE